MMRRSARVALRADMMGDQAHDVFAIGRCEPLARVGQAFREPVDPQPPFGFSITSTTAGSSRKRAMAGPSAVRSIRASRVKLSEFWCDTAFHPRSRRGEHRRFPNGDD